METDTYYKLLEIKKKYHERAFGKICQCLLALALAKKFPKANIDVRYVEGVDIIVSDENSKYAIEVKTTSVEAISFGEKDKEGLQKYKSQGYKPILAVLKLDMHRVWIFKNAEKLSANSNLQVNRLYTDDEYKQFISEIQRHFEEMVKEHYKGVFDRGENHLISVLKEQGLKYSGE